jgi:hypothetical protein
MEPSFENETTTTRSSMEAWYPAPEAYFLSDAAAAGVPVRQGDVLTAPPGFVDENGQPWHACQVVNPSCEIGAKKNPPTLHVVRIFPLTAHHPKDQVLIALGVDEEFEGGPAVAFAHTFFIPPIGVLEQPMFADFRTVSRVDRSHFAADNRVGAMTHDARVFFIRRKLYWEQRWAMNVGDVQGFEALRIGGDPAFMGPKPPWVV